MDRLVISVIPQARADLTSPFCDQSIHFRWLLLRPKGISPVFRPNEMEIPQIANLYITYLDKEGPFLKVWGQTEKTHSIFVEQILLNAAVQFDRGFGKIPLEALKIGTLVCAKYKDDKYYRARISGVGFVRDLFVEVNFLDYGNKDVVPCDNVRSIENFPPSFISIPPLANGFIFAEAHCPGGGEWNDVIFENIIKEIRYQDLQCKFLAQAAQYYLVKLYINNTDIGALLISRGLMQPISLQAQQGVLLSMSMQKRQQISTPPAAAAVAAPEINTYKACQLEPGAQYPVYVSYVNDGPTLFSVQLRQTEDVLVKLMKDINSIELRPLEELPLPGTICLARCLEDNNICRAVVTNEVDQQFKVFYVDFGNQEVVPLEALYQIPFKYVLPKVMAIRFGLAGVEKSTVTLEMSCAFKNFVDNRLLHMKVLPSATRTSVQKCELWDPDTKTSALDVLNRAARNAYPEPLALNRGTSQPVKVSFVYSCNRFYVQLVSKEPELSKLMLDLQTSCQNSDGMDQSTIRVGLPCCALFTGDQLWYRSEIVEVVDGAHVKVRYIDYGNEEVVPRLQLRMVEGELLTVLRPQAIECCLNGYQNIDPDIERDGFLEELILEQTFTMKVAEMLGKKALVELIDSANYNVASLLLDKIASAKQQASPLLVQAGNRIEHRKGSGGARSDGGGFRDRDRGGFQDREKGGFRDRDKAGGGRERTQNVQQQSQERENGKGWNNRNDKNNEKSWRDRDSNRNFDRDTNSNEESPEGGWRQNNRGFNRNRDDKPNNRETNDRFGKPQNRFNRDNDRFEKSDKENDRFGGRGKFNRDDNKPNRFNRDNDKNENEWKTTENAVSTADDTWGEEAPVKQNNDGAGDGWSNDSGHGTQTPKNSGAFGGSGRFNDGDRPPRRDFKDRNSKPGFKKRTDFRKDGSEMSSSGSEKGFQRGPRTSSRNERPDRNYQKRDKNLSFNSPTDNSWNVSSVTTSIDSAPADSSFTVYEPVGSEMRITVSWIHDPSKFFCQLNDTQNAFKKLMDEIQRFYKSRPPEASATGAPIIAHFSEDNVLYRGVVLESSGAEYKVFYVDFGNVGMTEKVWPIDRKFMEMPAQALCCALAGIKEPSGGWLDTESYKKYFEREGTLVARFVNKDYDKLYLHLFDGTTNIAEQLVIDGLAVAEQAEPQVEIPLLLGQQFRVVVKSVNNLRDIIVALECGVALSCSMHNVDLAAETFEHVLRAQLEQTVITYVDNILEDNRLEITLYDTAGNKIPIVSPDEGAFDTVDALCPCLVLSSTLTGFVSHVDDTSLFVQPSEYVDTALMFLETLFEFYDGDTQSAPMIPEEGMLYAVKSVDENWYRARVMSFDDDKASVLYVDYGNSEEVPFGSIRDLEKKFMVPNMMCMQLHVTVPTAQFLDKHISASIYYGESGWESSSIQLLNPSRTSDTTQSIPSIPISTPLETTQELDEQIPCAPPTADTTLTTTTDAEANEVVEDKLQCEVESETVAVEASGEVEGDVGRQKGVPVVVSHTDSPSEFYVQLGDALGAIEELQERLQAEALEMAVMENVKAGVLCAAPYSVDSDWYRAEVLDADDDITTVRFIDYGNTDVISNQSTQIKTLPPELLTLAVYATRCSLKAKPIEEEWSALAHETFEKLVETNTTAEFQDQDEKTHYVELYADGKNVKEELIKANCALPAEFVGENKSNCFISHLNSPSEFWIQLESCVDDLEWIAEQLATAEEFPELEDLAPGTLCAALFPDDEMWYRARILSNTVAGIELLFVDYGNSCTSNSLRQLPEELTVTPPLAQKCSLQKPTGIPYWTPQACEKFKEISADGQTIFTVKKVTSGETATVELLVNGEDSVEKLLATTMNGLVKDFESLENFSIEKPDGKVENCKLEAMPGMVWDESAADKFKEMNIEGLQFQIEFIDENTIRLYLNGNDIRPSLGGTKNSTITSPLKGSPRISLEKNIPSSEVEQKIIRENIQEKNIEKLEKDESLEVELGKSEKNVKKDTNVYEKELIESEEILSVEESVSECTINEHEEQLKNRLQNNVEKDTNIQEKESIQVEDKIDIEEIHVNDDTIQNKDEKSESTSDSQNDNKIEEKDLNITEKDLNIPEKDPKIPEKESLETEEKITIEETQPEDEIIEKPESRPQSRKSINYDEKIVPGAISRPHTPIEDDSEEKEDSSKEIDPQKLSESLEQELKSKETTPEKKSQESDGNSSETVTEFDPFSDSVLEQIEKEINELEQELDISQDKRLEEEEQVENKVNLESNSIVIESSTKSPEIIFKTPFDLEENDKVTKNIPNLKIILSELTNMETKCLSGSPKISEVLIDIDFEEKIQKYTVTENIPKRKIIEITNFENTSISEASINSEISSELDLEEKIVFEKENIIPRPNITELSNVEENSDSPKKLESLIHCNSDEKAEFAKSVFENILEPKIIELTNLEANSKSESPKKLDNLTDMNSQEITDPEKNNLTENVTSPKVIEENEILLEFDNLKDLLTSSFETILKQRDLFRKSRNSLNLSEEITDTSEINIVDEENQDQMNEATNFELLKHDKSEQNDSDNTIIEEIITSEPLESHEDETNPFTKLLTKDTNFADKQKSPTKTTPEKISIIESPSNYEELFEDLEKFEDSREVLSESPPSEMDLDIELENVEQIDDCDLAFEGQADTPKNVYTISEESLIMSRVFSRLDVVLEESSEEEHSTDSTSQEQNIEKTIHDLLSQEIDLAISKVNSRTPEENQK